MTCGSVWWKYECELPDGHLGEHKVVFEHENFREEFVWQQGE